MIVGSVRTFAALVAGILSAAAIGFGVPLFWLWIGSLIQSETSGALSFLAAATIFVGLFATYTSFIFLAGWLRAQRIVGGDPTEQVTRAAWNRSLRDEQHRPSALDPIERVFVVTTVVVTVAFMVWFFAFAGSPLPSY